MSEQHEYRVDYRAAATRRWRLYPAPFGSEAKALRFGESLLRSGEATAVRIYEEHVTRELWLVRELPEATKGDTECPDSSTSS